MFKIYKSHAYVKGELCETNKISNSSIRFISRTELHNGCDCYVENEKNFIYEKGNAIIIGDTTSTIFYQKENFLTGDHIVVCRADWLNTYTGLFVKTVLEKERFRYNYGRSFKMSCIYETKIKLPSKNGSPDWTYMENYIKSLPFGDRL